MKVYVLFRNADMTEGNGPMLIDRVFVTEHALEAYCTRIVVGVNGFKPPAGKTMYDVLRECLEITKSNRSRHSSEPYKRNPYGGWEGYEIVEFEAE